MGIEDYWTVISEVFPHAMQHNSTTTKTSFDHVMVDLNHVLYHVSSSPNDEMQIEAVLDYLNLLLVQFAARKSVFVALDGPGPRAKFLVQRDRREKVADRQLDAKALKYTPGSEFMLKLQLALFSWAAERASHSEAIKFFVSGSDREGEGELKIYQHLLNFEQIQDTGRIPSTHPIAASAEKDSVILIGTDSDLVATSFRLQVLKNIRITVSRMLAPHDHQLIDLEKLHSLMMGDLCGEPLRIIDDITFLSLMGGSDYMPKVVGYSMKAALLWYRNMKGLRANTSKYLISRQIDPKAGHTCAWQLNHDMIRDLVHAAEATNVKLDVLIAKVHGQEKRISLHRFMPKSILNSLAASLVRKSQVFYQTARVPELSAYETTINLTFADGKTLILAKRTAPSHRLAEIRAAEAALSLSGPFFQQICTSSIDSVALENLRVYLLSKVNQKTAAATAASAEASAMSQLAASANRGSEQLLLDGKVARVSNPLKLAAYEASRPGNEPAVIQEYLRMLIWTLEYYQGTCMGYKEVYNYTSAPTCAALKHKLPGKVSTVELQRRQNRVSGPSFFTVPLPIDEKPYYQPLVPLAFFTALMPPVSVAARLLPEPVRDAVLDYRSSKHENIIDFVEDILTTQILVSDFSDDFIAHMVSKVPEITSNVDFRHLTTFGPSYVFFQANGAVDPQLNRLKLDLSSLQASRYVWEKLKRRLNKLVGSDTSKVVCIAEQPAAPNHQIRRFDVIQNRFMQKRNFHSSSTRIIALGRRRSSISAARTLGCILKKL